MNKIKRLESARHMDGESWEVGQETGYKSGKFITKIEDATIEIVDEVYIPQYWIYADGQRWKDIVNMPVKVEYELEV